MAENEILNDETETTETDEAQAPELLWVDLNSDEDLPKTKGNFLFKDIDGEVDEIQFDPELPGDAPNIYVAWAEAPKPPDALGDEKAAEARAREAAEEAANGKKEDEPEDTSPNVKFVGKRIRNNKEEPIPEAPKSLISGPKVFDDLPSSEEQIKGFYYKRAAELCRAFPGLYKRIINKGE